MDELVLAADVLVKTAAYLEAIEDERLNATQAARTKMAEDLKSRFNEATGETLTDEVASKLASTDAEILGIIEKLAGSTQPPVSLGGPGDAHDPNAVPTTKKEAAAAAEDRFAAWLTS